MEEEEIGQLLLDYTATFNNPKYGKNWDVVDSKFPELAGYDRQVLHHYVATINNPKYGGDTARVNALFPELFDVKKKRRASRTARLGGHAERAYDWLRTSVSTCTICIGWSRGFVGITCTLGRREIRLGISQSRGHSD